MPEINEAIALNAGGGDPMEHDCVGGWCTARSQTQRLLLRLLILAMVAVIVAILAPVLQRFA